MTERTAFTLTVAVLLLLAAALRFYHLNWQYTSDEVASVHEERVLFHERPSPADSQEYRLPHAVPLGYLVIHLSHTLFGDSEQETRVLIALLGILTVALVLFLLNGQESQTTAVVAASLLALMPAHISFSQTLRFYAVATFFSFAALLVGARILGSRSGLFALLACGLAFLAMLSHTVLAVLLPLMLFAVWAGMYAQRRAMPRVVWVVFAFAAAAVLLFFTLYLRPLLHGWNEGETWGYPLSHALLASLVTIGWPTSLLAVVGSVLMLCERTPQNCYWLICVLGFVGATVMLPFVVIYHPGYVFPLSLGPLVAAATAITVIYTKLRERSYAAAYTWIGLILFANAPALASHYVDGDRSDMRGAAVYVREHWVPGDRVTGYAMGTFRHYGGECCEPAIPLLLGPNQTAQLARLAAEDGGRTWIVLDRKRAGLDPALQRWLFDCAIHKLSLGGRRFDDAEFNEEVYLLTPESSSTSSSCSRG